MQILIGALLIAGGLLAWWTGQDSQAALGLLATATGFGEIAVAWTRRSRDPVRSPDEPFPVEQLSL